MARPANPYAEGVTFHSPGSHRGKAAERTLGNGPQRSPYAEGVLPHSPGSRRGKAAKRTLGNRSHNTHIPRRATPLSILEIVISYNVHFDQFLCQP